MKNLYENYAYVPNEEAIGRSLGTIAHSLDDILSASVLKDCFSYMDLTTLGTTDSVASVTALVDKVNALPKQYPDYPLPASICVYPNFAAVVKSGLVNPEVHTTAVAGCFPTSQSFIDVKVKECEMAVAAGADEIDIVLALNSFMVGDYATAGAEIARIRSAVDAAARGRKVILKVILETGLLVTAGRIADASFLAMENGADFIKTSTGKVDVNATPMAACVMCRCIERFYARKGKKVGFKAAGGISTARDAVCYYSIVSSILGQEWLTKDLFRFGVSRLANKLMSEVEQRTVTYF